MYQNLMKSPYSCVIETYYVFSRSIKQTVSTWLEETILMLAGTVRTGEHIEGGVSRIGKHVEGETGRVREHIMGV